MKNLRTTRPLALVVALVLALCVTLPLAGCGSKDASTTDAGSAAAADQAAAITVTLNVDGTLGEGGAVTSEEVSVPAGASVLDALEASDVEYTAEDSDYGPYVTVINGIAAHDSIGWVYDVNGEEVMVGAGEYELSDGDVVNWTLVSYE